MERTSLVMLSLTCLAALAIPTRGWAVAQECSAEQSQNQEREAPGADEAPEDPAAQEQGTASEDTLSLKFFEDFAALTAEADALDQKIDQAIASALSQLGQTLAEVPKLVEQCSSPAAAYKQLDEALKGAFEQLGAARDALQGLRTRAEELQNLVQRGVKRVEAQREVLEPLTYGELRDDLVAVATRVADSTARLQEYESRLRTAQKVIVKRRPDLTARLFIATVSKAAEKVAKFVTTAEGVVGDIVNTLSPQKAEDLGASPTPTAKVIRPPRINPQQ